MVDDLFVFFSLQRTSRIDQSSARSNLRHSGTQNRNLTLLQIHQVLELESPLDFRITGQRTSARTRHIGEHAIKIPCKRKMARIRGEHMNLRSCCIRLVIHPQKFSEQARAMRMKLYRRDLRIRSAVRHRQGLAARRGAAVKHARPASRQRSDELRSFILDSTKAVADSTRLADIAALDQPRRGQETSSPQLNSFGVEFFARYRSPQANGRSRNRLVIAANALNSFDSVFPRPALYQPSRMRERMSDAFDRCADFILRTLISNRCLLLQLPQNSIDERSSRALVRSLHQFHALVDGRTSGNAAQPAQLVQAEAKSNYGFKVKLRQRLGGVSADLRIQQRAPAQDAEDEFGG